MGLLDCPDLLDLREEPEASKKRIASASAVLWSSFYGDELLLTRDQLARVAPDPKLFLKDRTVRQAMVREDNRNQVYRYTLKNRGRLRYFCFRLAALQDQGHW